MTRTVTSIYPLDSCHGWRVGLDGLGAHHVWRGSPPELGMLAEVEYVPDECGALLWARRHPDACVDCNKNIAHVHGRCHGCACATVFGGA